VPWDEIAFRARVTARCKRLGKPLATLLREAGVSKDVVRKVPQHGRRLDSLEGVARALGWTLGQALGLQDLNKVELDRHRLRLALEIAERVIDDNLPADPSGRLALVADVAAEAYAILFECEAAGQPVTNESAALIAAVLRRVASR
jgi:hypothetical protein